MKVDVITPLSKGGPYIWGKHLVKELKKKDVDAIHVCTLPQILWRVLHTNADLVHTTVPLSFRLWFKPVILTIKGDYRIEKFIWKLFYPLSIKYATTKTCSTKFLKNTLGINASIIPNGVDLDRFNLWKKHRPMCRVSIVTMTKFRFRDKAEGVYEIAKSLLTVYKPMIVLFRWTIIGGGEYLNEVKRKVDLIVKDRFPVDFLGFVDRPERELPKHDIFVYYSSHDSFATAVIEAMACGLPVVTNNYGPTKEIIKTGKDGFIENDTINYCESIRELIENWKKRKNIGIAARRKVQKFSWEEVADQYLTIYRRLLND